MVNIVVTEWASFQMSFIKATLTTILFIAVIPTIVIAVTYPTLWDTITARSVTLKLSTLTCVIWKENIIFARILSKDTHFLIKMQLMEHKKMEVIAVTYPTLWDTVTARSVTLKLSTLTRVIWKENIIFARILSKDTHFLTKMQLMEHKKMEVIAVTYPTLWDTVTARSVTLKLSTLTRVIWKENVIFARYLFLDKNAANGA